MRSPFQVAILVACVVTGIVGLLTGSASPNAIAQLFGNGSALWNLGVLAGGVGSLVAMWLRFPTNLLAERVGMIWLSTLFLAYGVAIVVVNDDAKAIASLGTVLAITVACIARAVQLTSHLRLLRNALAESGEQ